jgi:DNA-binding MarR family transcriptional regulator
MDNTLFSVPDVARDAGVSPDRVRRTSARLGITLHRAGTSTRATQLLDARARNLVLAELGVARPAGTGLSRSELRLLAQLARAPRGVISRRALARRSGLSPTTAARAVDSLVDLGFVTSSIERTALGRARDIEILRATDPAAGWSPTHQAVLEAATRTPSAGSPGRVPNELLHLFWNTSWTQLQLPDSARYVARRIASSSDLDALAWSASNLPATALAHARSTRGLSPQRRRLLDNIAREAAR